MSAPLIRLQGITREFTVGTEAIRALRDVNLEIARGEYISIMGSSGSGKSTLLNLIGLLDSPTSGQFWFNGADISAVDEQERARMRREKIGFVFQFFHLIPRLTAADNVALPLMLAGVPRAARRERVMSILAALGVADRAAHRPDQLSGGQRQRVAIARAVVGEPVVLLADEPTGNLDRASGQEVARVLEALNTERGLTLIVVTHDAQLGGRARRRLLMDDGRIVTDSAQ